MSLGPQVATSLTRYTVCVCSSTNGRRRKVGAGGMWKLIAYGLAAKPPQQPV